MLFRQHVWTVWRQLRICLGFVLWPSAIIFDFVIEIPVHRDWIREPSPIMIWAGMVLTNLGLVWSLISLMQAACGGLLWSDEANVRASLMGDLHDVLQNAMMNSSSSMNATLGMQDALNKAVTKAIQNRVVWHTEIRLQATIVSSLVGMFKSAVALIVSMCVMVGACANILVTTPLLTSLGAIIVYSLLRAS